jgi:hypothetical protein
MTLEFTARFDDSLADYIKETVEENLPDMDEFVKSDDISEAIGDHFSGGYTDPTDYFDMSSFVTDDDALTDDGVRELITEEMGDHVKTMTTLATTLQAITDALVAGGFVPTGWQAIPKEVA